MCPAFHILPRTAREQSREAAEQLLQLITSQPPEFMTMATGDVAPCPGDFVCDFLLRIFKRFHVSPIYVSEYHNSKWTHDCWWLTSEASLRWLWTAEYFIRVAPMSPMKRVCSSMRLSRWRKLWLHQVARLVRILLRWLKCSSHQQDRKVKVHSQLVVDGYSGRWMTCKFAA